MKVAWHEVPGKGQTGSVSAAADVICGATLCPPSETDHSPLSPTDHTVPHGTGPPFGIYQALRAKLPSYRPSGTKVNFFMLMQFRGRGMRGSDHSGATRHKTTCI
jgi:hypothetical protein